jgi:hypothetical protein
MSALGFRVELQKLINRESRENGSDTPDFILAEYLARCLDAFDHAVQYRERHYGRTCGSTKNPTVETKTEYVGNPCICKSTLALMARPDCPIHGVEASTLNRSDE